MKVQDAFTGVTEKEFTVTTECDRLMFLITHATNVTMTETVIIEKSSPKTGNNLTICAEMPLKALLALYASREDATLEKVLANDTTGNITSIKGSVELSKLGAVRLDSDEVIKVSLRNIVAGNTITVYGLENPIATPHVSVYERFQTDSQTMKEINTEDAEAILVERTYLTKLELVYRNKTVTYLPEELDEITRSEMGIMEVITADTGTPDKTSFVRVQDPNYYILGLQGCLKVKVHTSGTNTMVIIADTKNSKDVA